MANPALMTALGALGAGFSEYGKQKLLNEQIARENARTAFEQNLATSAERRASEAALRNQQLSAIEIALKGGTPGGQGPLSLPFGDTRFSFDSELSMTPAQKLERDKSLIRQAYPNLNDAQVELIARGRLTIPNVIPRPRSPNPATPAPTRTPTLFEQMQKQFGGGPASLTEAVGQSGGSTSGPFGSTRR